MAIFGKSHTIAKEICAVLGVDGNKVKDMTIYMPTNDIFTIDIQIMPDGNDVEQVDAIMKKFRVVPVDEPKPFVDSCPCGGPKINTEDKCIHCMQEDS